MSDLISLLEKPKYRLAVGASPEFNRACEKLGIPPTARQWSKYRRGYGRAHAGK